MPSFQSCPGPLIDSDKEYSDNSILLSGISSQGDNVSVGKPRICTPFSYPFRFSCRPARDGLRKFFPGRTKPSPPECDDEGNYTLYVVSAILNYKCDDRL